MYCHLTSEYLTANVRTVKNMEIIYYLSNENHSKNILGLRYFKNKTNHYEGVKSRRGDHGSEIVCSSCNRKVAGSSSDGLSCCVQLPCHCQHAPEQLRLQQSLPLIAIANVIINYVGFFLFLLLKCFSYQLNMFSLIYLLKIF